MVASAVVFAVLSLMCVQPHRQRHSADITPERHRPKAAALPAAAGRSPAGGAAQVREPLCSSGDGPPGSTAAAAAPGGASGVIRAAGVSRQPGLSSSSSVWKPPDVPAVGSVAMTVLPSERTWYVMAVCPLRGLFLCWMLTTQWYRALKVMFGWAAQLAVTGFQSVADAKPARSINVYEVTWIKSACSSATECFAMCFQHSAVVHTSRPASSCTGMP